MTETESKQALIDPDAPVSRREFERLRDELRSSHHDMTYYGDAYWDALRDDHARLARLGPTNFEDVCDDPRLQRTHASDSSEQWRRVRKALIKKHPHRKGCPYPARWNNDGLTFVEYHIHGRGRPKVYLSLRENMPCDVEIALRREHVSPKRFAQQLRRIRENWPLDGRLCRCGYPGTEHVYTSDSKRDDSMVVLHTERAERGESMSGPPVERRVVPVQVRVG
jgi:hypothetical protein